MGLFKSKRGITPLIATFLLVSFAVSVGAVVMQFGSGLETPTGCGADIQFKVTSCITESNLQYSVENIGSTPIEGVNIVAKGSKLGLLKESTTRVLPSAKDENTLPFDSEMFGKGNEVTFTPTMRIGEDYLSCEQNTITSEFSECK